MAKKKPENGHELSVGEATATSKKENPMDGSKGSPPPQRINRPHRRLINPFTGKPFGDGLSESAYG